MGKSRGRVSGYLAVLYGPHLVFSGLKSGKKDEKITERIGDHRESQRREDSR